VAFVVVFYLSVGHDEIQTVVVFAVFFRRDASAHGSIQPLCPFFHRCYDGAVGLLGYFFRLHAESGGKHFSEDIYIRLRSIGKELADVGKIGRYIVPLDIVLNDGDFHKCWFWCPKLTENFPNIQYNGRNGGIE
jgi:hypothetical protein